MGEDKVIQVHLQSDRTTGWGETVPLSSLPVSAQKQLAVLRGGNLEDLDPLSRRLVEIQQRGLPTIAFVRQGALPSPALALIVRDPSAEPSRLIVLEEGSTDWAFQLARKAMMADEVTVPDLTERRVLNILPDGQGMDEKGQQVEWIRPIADETGASRRATQIKTLLKRAKSPAVDLPGIGRAKIVR